MARKKAMDNVPEDIKKQFRERLTGANFQNYDELTQWLHEQGYEISRSSVHRYGKSIEEELEEIRISIEETKLLQQAFDDVGLELSGAGLLIAQEKMKLCIRHADTSTPEGRKELREFGTSIANVSRAAVNQKRWQTNVKEAIRKTEEALEAEGNFNDKQRNIIRELYGVCD